MSIDGVTVRDLVEHVDQRGSVQKIVGAHSPEQPVFGEVYASLTNPGVVKAWHLQAEQTNLLSCVAGRLRLVVHDARPDSPTRGRTLEVELGDGARRLVRIPPGVVYGWKSVGEQTAILVNVSDRPHDPSTSRKIDPASDEVPYAF